MTTNDFKAKLISAMERPVLSHAQLAIVNVVYATYDHAEDMPRPVRESLSQLINSLSMMP